MRPGALPRRRLIGIRSACGEPVLWCDPEGAHVVPGQHVRIVAEEGEGVARVVVAPTVVESDVPVAAVRILHRADDEITVSKDKSPTTVGAVESPSHHLKSPVAHDRIATISNRLLAIRREDRQPLQDLGNVLGDEDADNLERT